ncbi:MAG TPA: right-handed parallel beta-helix repeat-containing protein [Mycobacterium sp.]|nr:right-handed parallel beta-helix repeat-containing protein [Mycobacterium sp.]
MAASIVSPPKAAAAIDAGLSDAFQYPAPRTGRTLSVLNYGATPNNSADDDVPSIQKAINAAVAGDEVYLPDGTYDLKGKVSVNLKTGVSFRCQSQNAVLAGRYSVSPHAMLYAAPGVNNLTVSNCAIRKASGVNFDAGVRIGNIGSGALTSRIAVTGMLIEQFQRFAVLLQNAYHVLVDGNTIKNAVALGGGGSGYGVIIDQNRSTNNWVRNNTIGPVIRHALLIQFSANHNLLEKNTVTGAVSGAIDMHGEDEFSNEIRYNTVKDCVRNGTSVSPNGAGIELGEWSGVAGITLAHDNSGPNNWVHHNEVYNCTHGLRIMNDTNYTYVEDNNFHNNLMSGIQADLAPLNHLYIQRNTINNNNDGVLLYAVDYATVEGNTITNNLRNGLWTDPKTIHYTITNNTIANNKTNVRLGSTNGTYTPGPAPAATLADTTAADATTGVYDQTAAAPEPETTPTTDDTTIPTEGGVAPQPPTTPTGSTGIDAAVRNLLCAFVRC